MHIINKWIYGKFFFSSNTLAVRTPKIILKLLLKTFSFSSNSDFFSCIQIFNTSNTKNCKKQCLNFTKPCQIFRCFVFPRRMSKERQLYRLNIWCTVRLESDLQTSKKYFIDVLMFPLFGKISWRKKWLSSVKLKTKSEELECVIFILSFNLRHHSFYTGLYDLWRFPSFKWKKKKNPTLPVHHMYCWTYSTW